MPPEVLAELETQGFALLPATSASLAWATAARAAGQRVVQDPGQRARWLRHGGTWFVGVDALPTAADGACAGTDLPFAPWLMETAGQGALHPAQLSVIYPGYPGQEKGEGKSAHVYRIKRAAAHVDGLLKTPQGGRVLAEAHAVILGIGLSDAAPEASPLVVWPGSHRVLGPALAQALPVAPPHWAKTDIAPSYTAARRSVFATLAPKPCPLSPGQTILLHRHLLHGIAPWADGAAAAPEGRMTAYFRPTFADPQNWLP